MPVSCLPLIFPALLVGVPLLFLITKGQKSFRRAAAVSASILVLLFLWVYVPGWVLTFKAHRGDRAAMYELARWTENHDSQIGQLILWPGSPDVRGGYAWLEKAAAVDYPPALYAMGVRIKHRIFAPSWISEEEAQALIDKALRLGYKPTIEEDYVYFGQYRK